MISAYHRKSESTITCPICDGWMSWNSYFQAYICEECGNLERTEKKREAIQTYKSAVNMLKF